MSRPSALAPIMNPDYRRTRIGEISGCTSRLATPHTAESERAGLWTVIHPSQPPSTILLRRLGGSRRNTCLAASNGAKVSMEQVASEYGFNDLIVRMPAFRCVAGLVTANLERKDKRSPGHPLTIEKLYKAPTGPRPARIALRPPTLR